MGKIVLKNIQKKYPDNDFYNVKDFNLEIEDGEFIVLVGPSGCGKSTTLRMIAGLEDITDGELWINGTLANKVEPKDRDIAMVFQSYALYPHMSVRDNITYGLKLRKTPKEQINQKLEVVSKQIELEEYLDRLPKALSGGQRQRVALGRAMVRKPIMYLMDEPLSNLDAKLRTTTRAEISRLHRQQGAITVYVTHDQVEAMTMADRIVVMSMGEVQQIGTPKELYKNPKNLFVATFIGQPTMNNVKGKYEKGNFKGGAIIDGKHIIDIDLAEAQKNMLDSLGYDGKEVILGIRAQSIKETNIVKDTFPNSIVKMKPTILEYLGDHLNTFFEVENKNYFTAILQPDCGAQIDEEFTVAFESTKLYFFDCETQLSINYLWKNHE